MKIVIAIIILIGVLFIPLITNYALLIPIMYYKFIKWQLDIISKNYNLKFDDKGIISLSIALLIVAIFVAILSIDIILK